MGAEKTRWRWAVVLAGIASIVSLSIACSNMLSGSEVTEKITDEVNEANAEEVTITIQNDPDMKGGTLSLSGTPTEKVGIAFTISTEVADAYVFKNWTFTSSAGGTLTFSDASAASTTATITKAASDIVIQANYYERPTVKFKPIDGAYDQVRNVSITLTFSNPMNTELNYLNLGYIKVNESNEDLNIASSDVTSSYFSGVTWNTLKTQAVLNYNSGIYLKSYYTYEVVVAKDVEDENGITMQAEQVATFDTSDSTDAKPPIVDSFYVGSSGSGTATTLATNASSIYLSAEAEDNSGSVPLMLIKEFFGTDTSGDPLSTDTMTYSTDWFVHNLVTASGDGIRTITMQGKDKVGNITSITDAGKVTVYYDTTAPTVTSFPTPTYASDGEISLTAVATDATSGVATYEVSGDDVESTVTSTTGALTFNITTSSQGAKSVRLRVKDAAGNWSGYTTKSIMYDTEAPSVTSFPTPTYCNASDGTVTLTATGSDSLSGIAAYEVSGDVQSTVTSATGALTFKLTTGSQGAKSVKLRVQDGAGNWSGYTTNTITLDNLAPDVVVGTITVTLANTGYAIENSLITIPLTITEAYSGIATKPTVQITTSSGAVIGTATVGAVSGTSPTYSCSATYTMDSDDTEGALYYTISATADGAGNVMTTTDPTTMSRIYDRTLPEGSYIYLGSATSPGATYTKTGTPVVYSDASDTNGYGLLAQFSYDGGTTWLPATPGTFTPNTSAVDLTSGDQGSRTVQMKLYDAAGNQKTATLSDDIIYDSGRPTVAVGTIEVTLANTGYAISGSEITIPLTITEDYSGIATKPTVEITDSSGTSMLGGTTVSVTTPSGTSPTYSCSATVTMDSDDTEGTLYIKISGTQDGAGNVMTTTGPTTMSRIYDRSLPTGSYIYLGSATSPGATYTKTGTPVVYSDASDANGYGLLAQFSYDGGTTWLPTTPGTFTPNTSAVDLTSGAQGSRTVQMKLYDAAGNQKTATLSDDIIYDSGRPTVTVGTITVTGANTGYAISGSEITIPLEITEAYSGIATKPTVEITDSSETSMLGGTTVSVTEPSGSGPTYSCTATVTMDSGDTEGALYIKISGTTDGAGNVMTTTGPTDMNLIYDRTLPTGSYIYLGSATSPGATYTTTGTPVVYSNASDTNGYGLLAQFSYDGGTTWLPATPGTFTPGTSAVDLTSGDQGSRTVQMKLYDAAGNQKTATLSDSITYDSYSPTVAVGTIDVTLANTGYAIENSLITIPLTITEATTGIATKPTVEITNSSGTSMLVGTNSVSVTDPEIDSGDVTGSTYTCTATVTMDSDDTEGALYIKISATEDGAGNVMTTTGPTDMSLTYDRTLTLSIDSPAADAYINADATMTLSVTGGSGGTVTAKLSGYDPVTYTSGSTTIYSLSSTGWGLIAEGGTVAVTVYATDAAGNAVDVSRNFKKDTVAPSYTVANVSPSSGTTYAQLSVASITDTSGVVTILAFAGNAAPNTKTEAQGLKTITFSATTSISNQVLTGIDKTATFSFQLVDQAGNIGGGGGTENYTYCQYTSSWQTPEFKSLASASSKAAATTSKQSKAAASLVAYAATPIWDEAGLGVTRSEATRNASLDASVAKAAAAMRRDTAKAYAAPAMNASLRGEDSAMSLFATGRRTAVTTPRAKAESRAVPDASAATGSAESDELAAVATDEGGRDDYSADTVAHNVNAATRSGALADVSLAVLCSAPAERVPVPQVPRAPENATPATPRQLFYVAPKSSSWKRRVGLAKL